MSVKEMTCEEIDQFLTCTRIGRLGMVFEDGPYVVPVGFAYAGGKVFFHTCCKGLKMESLRKNTKVCFEVDEALSDATMSKSVIIFGTAEIIEDEQRMIPYLQKLIDKYRVPLNFDEYMRKPGRNRESELKAARICLITPTKITGRKLLPKEELHPTST
ncbi:MAG: pyridoxamine 5'-phosphate oxidase family protein [Candidatus Bathyarchaeia archaeon]|jgi:nitroimidazol reductase NimA-like FMN-containing flavoprotein (pyridoxamine 5'-phosphate oxidase superfamily)